MSFYSDPLTKSYNLTNIDSLFSAALFCDVVVLEGIFRLIFYFPPPYFFPTFIIPDSYTLACTLYLFSRSKIQVSQDEGCQTFYLLERFIFSIQKNPQYTILTIENKLRGRTQITLAVEGGGGVCQMLILLHKLM